MRSRILALLLLVSCARKIDGPAPTITATVNELDPTRQPATVCNAEGDAARGWLVDALGDNFSPLPLNALAGSPSVQMPSVTLSGPEAFTLQDANVFFVDKTRLPLGLPTRDTIPAHQLVPGTYTLSVTNPNGRSAQLASALTVVPPPTVASVKALDASGNPIDPNICSDKAQTLVITGTGFRTDVAPTVAFVGAAATVPAPAIQSPVSATQITISLPSGLFSQTQGSAAGTSYTVRVSNADGCVAPYGSDPKGFGVTDVTVFNTCFRLGALAVSPRFGWAQQNQRITITNAFTSPTSQPFSGGAPAVFINAQVKGTTGVQSVPLRRVAYVDPRTITAVVPTCSGFSSTPASGATPADCPNGLVASATPYDIVVQDPSGASGTITGAFTVVTNPPPSISGLNPSSITAGGATVTVSGANFDTPGPVHSSVLLGSQVTGGVEFCPLATSGTPSATSITANVPSSLGPTGCYIEDAAGNQTPATSNITLSQNLGLYLVRVQHSGDAASADFAGLIVTGSAANPVDKGVGSSVLNVARADSGVVVGSDDLGNPFLYAVGGSTGTAQLDSVEVAPIGPFGDLGGDCSTSPCKFRLLDRTRLPTARNGLALVARTISGDTTYLYAIGGRGIVAGTPTALTDVLRAQVLRNSDAPVISSVVSTGAGNLAKGTYYYRVSAILNATDPKNPGGETLASDEEPITLVNGNERVNITWNCTAAPSNYRVYRTPGPSQPSGSEVLVQQVTNGCTGPSTQTYTDNTASPSGVKPLPAGAIGVWVPMTTTLVTGRFQHQAKLVGSDILVVGGCGNGATGCASAGDLASSERSTFASATTADPGVFALTPASLVTPRKRFGLAVVDSTSGPSVSGGPYLLAVGGDSNGTEITGRSVTLSTIEAATVSTLAFSSVTSAPQNAGQGGWAEAAANQVFFEETLAPTSSVISKSSYFCGNSATCPVTSTASFSFNFNSGFPTYAQGGTRFLAGEQLFRAYIYAVGGFASNATLTPTNTVERIVY